MMKKSTLLLFVTAVSAALFAGSVTAAGSSIYGGFAEGNPDLYPSDENRMITGSHPGVGDSYNVYQGDWARGNSDLFTGTRGDTMKSGFPDIYQGFGDNPDL